MAKILLIEDDLLTCKMVREWLEHELHVIDEVHNGVEAKELLALHKYDVIILDLGLPDLDGYVLLREFRASGSHTPLLILTGKRSISEKEEGFESGADDYLTKPFAMRELSLRIKALLRRPPELRENSFAAGCLLLDPQKCIVTVKGEPVDLFPREIALLEFLIKHPNQVFTPEALLDRVWKYDSEVNVAAIRSCISRLRKKIAVNDSTTEIVTVRGLGYKLQIDQ
jgi:two-component system OmpR family response regulator